MKDMTFYDGKDNPSPTQNDHVAWVNSPRRRALISTGFGSSDTFVRTIAYSVSGDDVFSALGPVSVSTERTTAELGRGCLPLSEAAKQLNHLSSRQLARFSPGCTHTCHVTLRSVPRKASSRHVDRAVSANLNNSCRRFTSRWEHKTRK